MVAERVDVQGVFRRLRGGSQAHLVKGSDGHTYVAKFAGNPQGNRTLINECIAYSLFKRVGISVPPMRLLRLSRDVINKASLHFQAGSHRVPVLPGLHLGSRCPADPATTAIFDFLPRKLLHNVVNVDDFAKAFLIDKLLGQTDSRQCIFLRERGHGKDHLAFRAYMIDHGGAFAGTKWAFEDSPLHGLSFDRSVYSLIDMHCVCQQALKIIREVSEAQLYASAADIPMEWFADENHDSLERLLSEVVGRIARIDSLLWWQLDVLMSKGNDATGQLESATARLSALSKPASLDHYSRVPEVR
jgi:hypothetical protein